MQNSVRRRGIPPQEFSNTQGKYLEAGTGDAPARTRSLPWDHCRASRCRWNGFNGQLIKHRLEQKLVNVLKVAVIAVIAEP